MASRLERDGYVHIPGIVAPPVLERLRAATDRLQYVAAGAYGAICHNPWRRDAAFLDAVRELDLATLAAAAIGVDRVRWFQDHIFAKPPAGDAAILWHQDYSSWPLDRSIGATMWIALDDATAEAGCLQYVPASHAGGERRPAEFSAGIARPERIASLEPIPIDDANRRAVAIPIAAGDVLMHHPLTWHRSGPNRTSRPRRGWSISWIDPAARWAPDRTPHPFLLELAPVAGTPVEGDLFPEVGR